MTSVRDSLIFQRKKKIIENLLIHENAFVTGAEI